MYLLYFKSGISLLQINLIYYTTTGKKVHHYFNYFLHSMRSLIVYIIIQMLYNIIVIRKGGTYYG